jgi:DNA-binding NarL/FixJ family response regulator
MTPKTISCVLVDDEQPNLEILADYVEQIPYLSLKATFDKPIEALAYLLKTPTDLLITDINMPRLSGIELYEGIYNSVSTQVIFVSGYADKIIEALEFCVTDYLHKPVSFLRLEKATQKAFFFANFNKKSFENLPTEVLETALENYSNLSETEKKILALISGGNPTQKIAELVFASLRTIESHRYTIRKKLKLLPDVSLTEIAKFITERIK